MPRIEYQDLADIDGYRRAITEAKADYKAWIDESTRLNALLLASTQTLRAELQRLNTQSATAPGGGNSATQLQLLTLSQQLAAQYTLQTQTQAALTNAQQQNAGVVTLLTARLDAAITEYNALDRSVAGNATRANQLTREMTSLQRQLIQVAQTGRQAAQSAATITGQYNQLDQVLNNARRDLKALDDAFDANTGRLNRNNAEAVRLSGVIGAASTQLRQMDAGMQVWTRDLGNYSSAWQGLGNQGLESIFGRLTPLITQFASASSAANVATAANTTFTAGTGGTAAGVSKLVLGLGLTALAFQAIAGPAQEALDTMSKYEQIRGGLKGVTKDADDLAHTQEYLQATADRLGVSYEVLANAYKGVKVGTVGTTLEGKEAERIFTAFTNRLAEVKAPADKTQRALEALTQMLSKGNVAAEELRGQLGDAMPGAFKLFADALGVSTQKLNKMLKDGQVLAADVLPKVADQLEKTYTGTALENVNSLAGATARLDNQTGLFLDKLNQKLGITAFFANLKNGVSDTLSSISEAFKSAAKLASDALTKQTAEVTKLDSALPGLLTKYDELKNKTNLSATEQKELQSVINRITSLVPSAATGFDTYGNALDVNKSKVLSFTLAQRDLNAELNKQAIATLRQQSDQKQTEAQRLQAILNARQEQQKPSFKPYILQSQEERRRSLAPTEAERRTVPLSDARELEIQKEAQNTAAARLNTLKQIITLGGQLNDAEKQYIQQSGDLSAKQLIVIDDYTQKIAQKTAQAADLFQKQAFKEREGVVKELGKLKADLGQILSPSLPNPKAEGDTSAAEKAARKAEAARRKLESEGLRLDKADTTERLAELARQHEDGLIGERKYYAERFKITTDGIDKEIALLTGKGQERLTKEKTLNAERLNAQRAYKNDLLKYELSASATDTKGQLTRLGEDKEDGRVSEVDYIARRRDITVAGITERQQLLFLAGRQETEEYKKTETEINDAERAYGKDRNRIQEEAFKKALDATKDGLASSERLTESGLKDKLAELQAAYEREESAIESSIRKREVSEKAGQEKLYQLKVAYLEDIQKATLKANETEKSEAVQKYDELTKQAKTEEQVYLSTKDRKKKLDELEAERKKAVADKDVALATATAAKITAIENQTQAQKQTIQDKAGEVAIAAVSGYIGTVNAFRDQDIAKLEKQKQKELDMAGDNAVAKAAIEKKYTKQENEIKHKQDVSNRNAALFEIAVNTAVNASKVLANPILLALVIGLGAIQAAVVAARPLPEYFRGTSDAPEGPAWVGEQGYELIESKNGGNPVYRLAAEKQVMYLNKHDRVYTHQETKRRLQIDHELTSEVHRAPGGSMYQAPVIMQGAGGITKADLLDAFSQQMVHEQHWDEKGYREYERKKQQRTEWLNSYFSLPKTKH